MELPQLIDSVANILVEIDSNPEPFKAFRAGVGPYGEPQLLRLVAEKLNSIDPFRGLVFVKRSPDVLVKGHWALEFKLARPFGDNGKEAENWSVNLLHPYQGNVSAIGDCLKLRALGGCERKAAVVIGYEHSPPRISLTPLFTAFEILAKNIAGISLGRRVLETRSGLAHPVHQQLTVAAWEVLG